MKVVICDEHEKKAMDGLFSCLHDYDILDSLKSKLEEFYNLDNDDLEYLEAAIYDHAFKIDGNSYQTMIYEDKFIGKCSVCGKETTGLLDDGEGSLSLLKSIHNPKEKWYCESCFENIGEE